MRFGKRGQSHLLAEQAIDDPTLNATPFSTANSFRRKAVTVMRTFLVVAIFCQTHCDAQAAHAEQFATRSSGRLRDVEQSEEGIPFDASPSVTSA